MAHPDLVQLQNETHTVRVHTAWSSLGEPVPPAVEIRLEQEALEFLNTSLVKPRSRPPKRRRVKNVPRIEPNETLGCTPYPNGFQTHSFVSPNALKTSSVKITCSTLTGGRISFRASTNITHDVHGHEIEPIRVTAPVLRTSKSKEESFEDASDYLNGFLFEVYVRVVSHMRRIMFLPGDYPGSEVDTTLSTNTCATIADYKLPDGVHTTPYSWELNKWP